LDSFVDFWSGQDAVGSPTAVLPLERYLPGGLATDKVMCVTCHNPHGTDLHVEDTGGNRSIPDNNMLRLRDENNMLCEGCH
jgi:hypothetical protein